MIWIAGLIVYLVLLAVGFAPFILSGRMSKEEEKEGLIMTPPKARPRPKKVNQGAAALRGLARGNR